MAVGEDVLRLCDDYNRRALMAIAALAGEVTEWANLTEAQVRDGLRNAQASVDNFSNGCLQRAEAMLTNRYASLPASAWVCASVCAAATTCHCHARKVPMVGMVMR
eukprot:GHVU01151228.1.p1 GENE.GHVU01151228.1~~GHVU01151228.1.p1  ORF type:complete len:106 (-),score=15.64 GHVU01151228.1:326-643(-)